MNNTCAVINLDNLRHNIEEIRKRMPTKELACVVKADAYGHGDCVVAHFLEDLGINFFAVSCIDEALHLRNSGVKREILILGYTPPEYAKVLSENNISQAVYSPEYAKALAWEAKNSGCVVKIHIAIDSGMNRIGFFSSPEEIINSVKRDEFIAEGIFTHFSSADMFDSESVSYTDSQEDFFRSTVEALSEMGLSFKYIHSFNSAATLTRTDDFTNLCRVGIIIYGLAPSDYDYKTLLKPVMTFKSVISMIKTLPEGRYISYGREYVTEKQTRVATVAAGYADGYPRKCGGRADVIIRSKRCPVIGRVCMDQFMVDVTDVPDAIPGDEVILFGEDVTADEIAKINGTINYEIVCAISKRVNRHYIKDNKLYIKTHNVTEVENG